MNIYTRQYLTRKRAVVRYVAYARLRAAHDHGRQISGIVVKIAVINPSVSGESIMADPYTSGTIRRPRERRRETMSARRYNRPPLTAARLLVYPTSISDSVGRRVRGGLHSVRRRIEK